MGQRRGMVIHVSLCCPAISRAESRTAAVNGQVRDTSGAAIPNATVQVINDATGSRSTTETNGEGIYSVANPLPGTYRIQVSKTGFKTTAHPDVVLHVQGAETFDLSLPTGPTSDPATVEGSAPPINTMPPPASMLAVSSIRGGWLSMLRRFVFDFSEAVPLIMLLLLEVWAFLLFLDKLYKLLKKP